METPEMNDELAKELGFESLEDLKRKRQKISLQKERKERKMNT